MRKDCTKHYTNKNKLETKKFLPFKDDVIFSFETIKDKSFEDYQIIEVAPNVRILRLAIVYGANESGKNNLIEVFEFLRHFWFNKLESKDKSRGVILFLLDKDTPNVPSKISLTFYIKGIKYMYSLELEKEKVISEKLNIYSRTQPAMIFGQNRSQRSESD